MPNNTFADIKALAQSQPVHREVQVPKISLDLSYHGILNRLDQLTTIANSKGAINDADFQAIKTHTQSLQTVFAKIDHSKVEMALKDAPVAGIRVRPIEPNIGK